jgi:hydrogenase nickel insertion protein HypA
MHESAVAVSVVESIVMEAEKINARPIRARISCGQFNALNDEAMQVAFEAASIGTICEKMKLNIEHKPLEAMCRKCKMKFEYDVYSPQCPGCSSEEMDLQPDAPLLLEEIEFEQD